MTTKKQRHVSRLCS